MFLHVVLSLTGQRFPTGKFQHKQYESHDSWPNILQTVQEMQLTHLMNFFILLV
jgi:hypothetical protein